MIRPRQNCSYEEVATQEASVFRPVSSAEKSYLHDTLGSANPCFLSFSGFYPDGGKVRVSLAFYL